MTDLKKLEWEKIDKTKLAEFEQERMRGTGYDLMRVRDRAWGITPNHLGGEVVVEWNVDGAEFETPEGVAKQNVPKGMFYITIGKEKALLDSEAFRKLFRWV